MYHVIHSWSKAFSQPFASIFTHRPPAPQPKKTLTSALCRERQSVYDLEEALEISTAKASALQDVVASRDAVVSELNDRIAVFEEDKGVLKAALRQLQVDLREEMGPKAKATEELIEMLKKEAEILQQENEVLCAQYEEREVKLRCQLDEAELEGETLQERATEAESYARMLEDRMADAAAVRREAAADLKALQEDEFREKVETAALGKKEDGDGISRL
mmetsp:Transcript_21968/g.50079  ORF Transcript_21968/g.50079 Transcript_21968/m.50079 type:complete len:219 (-) Transcript_21968:261-917(-)